MGWNQQRVARVDHCSVPQRVLSEHIDIYMYHGTLSALCAVVLRGHQLTERC